MATPWKTATGLLLLLCAVPGLRAEGPLCPAGEITLDGGQLRIEGHRGRPAKVASTGVTFVVPTGGAIEPATGPVVFALEGDRVPIGEIALPAGSLVAHGGGKRFAYQAAGSELSLDRVRASRRLTARFGNLDLAGLDLAHPPRFLKQILKVGDDCFTSVLACTTRRGGITCAPERTAVLAGRVEQGRHVPLPGATLTLFDDARLETVSVFAQEDGHYVFPRLRPGTYRLRARLIGYEDIVRADVS